MIKFIIRDSLKSIKLKSIYSLIRVISLAIGLICFSLFMTIVINEYSFDKYQEKGDRIFRLVLYDKEQNNTTSWLPGMAKDLLNDKFPQVEEITRIIELDRTLKIGDNDPVTKQVIYADPGLFNVFSWKLVDQDGTDFLTSPDKIYISQTEARRIFKEENPLGKIITINNTRQFAVGGIFEDIPARSFIRINYLISTEAIKTSVYLTNPDYRITNFFLLLKDGKFKDETQKAVNKLVAESFKADESTFKITLQPLRDIYLHSDGIMQPGGFKSGNIQIALFLPWIALFILIIALGNYMVLDIGNNMSKIFRIGISKTYGESKMIVFWRFYTENFIYILSAALISALLIISLRNTFSVLSSGAGVNEFFTVKTVIILIILTIVLPLIPALYSSSLVNNITIPDSIRLKKSRVVEFKIAGSKYSINLRRLMLSVQFFTSVSLIIASLIAGRQYKYITKLDPGFEKKNLIVVNNYLRGSNPPEQRRLLASHLAQGNTLFTGFSSASNYPLGHVSNTTQLRLPSQRPDEEINAGYIGVDFDFFKTIGATIIKGRDFSKTFSTDSVSAVIINEQLEKRIGGDAIGKKLIGFWGNNEKIVVGVVKDIYFGKTDKTPDPMAFVVNSTSIGNDFELFFRTGGNMSQKALEFLKNNWKQVDPGLEFSYFLMEDQFNEVYSKEIKIIKALAVSTLLSLFLLLLGVISVSYLVSTSKVNEMGIRRILGAGTNNILKIFLNEYVSPFIIASCLAIPLVYLLLNEWLTKYVNRVQIGFDVFLFAIVALAVSFLAISGLMTWKIIRDNPVQNLRYE